jgi:hypothetical protein
MAGGLSPARLNVGVATLPLSEAYLHVALTAISLTGRGLLEISGFSFKSAKERSKTPDSWGRHRQEGSLSSALMCMEAGKVISNDGF